MRITHISITNLRRFDTFEADLPAVAFIQAANGAGKSSFLDCLKYAHDKGHDPNVIHAKAVAGEVIVSYDDGSRVKARATRDPNKTTRGWSAPGSKRFDVGRDQIDAIANALSYDPLAFMNLKPAEQVETLLSMMPLALDPEAIIAAVGDAGAEAASADIAGVDNPLEIIAR